MLPFWCFIFSYLISFLGSKHDALYSFLFLCLLAYTAETPFCYLFSPRVQGADNESGVTNLREMTSGLMPETTRLAWRSYLALCTEGASFKEDVVVRGRAPATLPFTSKSKGFDMEGTVRAPKLAADFSLRGQDSFQERSTAVGTSLCSYGQGAANSSPYTPAKSFSIPRAGDEESSWSGCIPPTPPTPPPLTPTTSTTTKVVLFCLQSSSLFFCWGEARHF